jgi:hypothetical protein
LTCAGCAKPAKQGETAVNSAEAEKAENGQPGTRQQTDEPGIGNEYARGEQQRACSDAQVDGARQPKFKEGNRPADSGTSQDSREGERKTRRQAGILEFFKR